MKQSPQTATAPPPAAGPACGKRQCWRWLLPAATGVALLACYLGTLAPTICGRDSGELATAVHVMGVPHPTGYPLYLLVGKLFDLLPWGEPAGRLGVFSAVCAAGAGALICWLVVALTGNRVAGVLGGLAGGLNWWVWDQANQVEVYGLHALLVCALLAAFVGWMGDPSPRRVHVLALLAGLGLAHHRTSLFFGGPLLLIALASTRPRRGRQWLAAAGWAAAPLLLYLWLPLRSATHPLLDLGNTSGSLQFFWWQVNGSIYLPYALQSPASEAARHAGEWAGRLWRELGLVGLGLAGVGMAGLARRRPTFGWALVGIFVLVAGWAAWYHVKDRAVFFMPGVLILALWCGVGLAFAQEWAGRRLGRGARWLPAAAAAVTALVAGTMIATNWRALDHRGDYRPWEQARMMTAGIPPDAVVLLTGDQPNGAAWYRYYVRGEGKAPLLLCSGWYVQPWFEPLLADPGLRRAAVLARRQPAETRTGWLPYGVRALLDPARPLYTNITPSAVPPGYVLLQDYTLSRLVRAPGLPLAGDGPGRPQLEFPAVPQPGGREAEVGSLLHLELPESVRRGEPFPITAAIRWRAVVPPVADLQVVLVHASLAGELGVQPEVGFYLGHADRVLLRPVPLLFRWQAPATPPGRHYGQRFWAMPSRRLVAGEYRAYAQLVLGEASTPLEAAGEVRVR